jgi:glycosyltransferase involved in cell wall biosynthesis
VDLRPCYERASLVVVPLRLGSGTRLKVLEALALGKAVVSTSLGAEGLSLAPDVHLALGDTADALANACVNLLRDTAQRRALGRAGRSFVTSRFTWSAIGRSADRQLSSLVPSLRLPQTAVPAIDGARIQEGLR